jgi:DNA-binding NarL/FixJ family response regulator
VYQRGNNLKLKPKNQPIIRVAVAGDDPLRLIGFRAFLDAERDLELTAIGLSEIEHNGGIDVVLLKDGPEFGNQIEQLKARNPEVRVLATGPRADEESILRSIALGARGYSGETASSAEFANAIRTVHQGLVWAPRRVCAMLIDRAGGSAPGLGASRRANITCRETEVLKMLAAGRSNKEIAAPLGIEERTVKAHVAHLMRKTGVQNRIALAIHAITHSMVEV